MKLHPAQIELRKYAYPKKQQTLARFFKTGPGEYGEGDRFLGVMVPQVRKAAQLFPDLSLPEIETLLKSEFNEDRLLALIILEKRFERSPQKQQSIIYRFYIKNLNHVNNWNLVDASAAYIAGPYLFTKNKAPLYRLARSPSLWKRRVAIVTTFYFIRQGEFKDLFSICKILLSDSEDLIHKACGWMLREAGKRNLKALEMFLKKNADQMPRTMLRYAIERFPKTKRLHYLKSYGRK